MTTAGGTATRSRRGAPRRRVGGHASHVTAVARFTAGICAAFVLSCAAVAFTLAAVPTVLTPWSSTVVGSGSMRPLLHVGDVVLLRPARHPDALAPGAVVLVEDPTRAHPLLHRVIGRQDDGYVTKGDANPTADTDLVVPGQVRATGRLLVPVIGRPLLWISDGEVPRLLLLVSAVVVLARLARYGWSDEHDPWAHRTTRRAGARHRRPRPGSPGRVRVRAGLTSRSGLVGLCVLGLIAVGLVGSVPSRTAAAAFTGSTLATGSMTSSTVAPATGLTATTRCGGGSPPTAPASSAMGNKSGANVTLTVPAGVVAGDLLLAHILSDGANTAASGFTTLASTVGASLVGTLYQRIAVASDASKAYSFPASGTLGSGGVVVLRGTAGLLSVANTAGTYFGSTTTIVTPSVTASSANSMVISIAGTRSSGGPGVPGGVTTLWNFAGSGTSQAAVQETQASSGATATRSFGTGVAAPSVGETVVVPPGGTVQAVDLAWTATTSTFATGYKVVRDAGAPTSVTPRTTTVFADNTPGTGSRVYQVTSVAGTWSSTAASVTMTPSCP